MTTTHAAREAAKLERAATRERSADDRARRAGQRLGRDPGPVDRAVQVGLENPPTLAAGTAGLVGALFTWGIAATAFPPYVDGALAVFGAAAAAAVGKVAQRYTYDRAGMDESVANFVDDLHRVAGTEPAEPGPAGWAPESG